MLCCFDAALKEVVSPSFKQSCVVVCVNEFGFVFVFVFVSWV